MTWKDFFDEFRRAPIGSTGAVVAMADVAFRIVEHFAGAKGISSSGPASQEAMPSGGIPPIWPLLDFIFFQIAIGFGYHKANLWSSKYGLGAQCIAGVLSTFLAAYATSYNAYAITLNQITTAGVHYTIFGAFLLFGITLTAFLFVVFHFESSDAASYTRRWSRSFVYALPMFLLFFGICIFLEPRFEDGLEPIWAAKTHQRQ